MERYIDINGEKIPVTEEVYRAYKRPAWRERKHREVRKEKERSLEAFTDAGFDIPSSDALTDEVIEDKLLLETLMDALEKLTAEERELINALYYQGMSERDFSNKIGVPQTTINYQKNRILKWLKKYVKN